MFRELEMATKIIGAPKNTQKMTLLVNDIISQEKGNTWITNITASRNAQLDPFIQKSQI